MDCLQAQQPVKLRDMKDPVITLIQEVIVTIVHLQSVRTEQTPAPDQATLVDALRVSTQNRLALVLLSQRSVPHVLLSQRSVLHVSFSILYDCDLCADQATLMGSM